MKITIDTQTDTYEDIKKVLHILSNIIEKKDLGPIQSNPLTSQPVDTSSMMNLFNDDSTTKKVLDTPPDFSSFLNLTDSSKEEKKKDNNWRIEYF